MYAAYLFSIKYIILLIVYFTSISVYLLQICNEIMKQSKNNISVSAYKNELPGKSPPIYYNSVNESCPEKGFTA